MEDCLKCLSSSSLAISTRTIHVYYGPVRSVGTTLSFKIGHDVSTMSDIDLVTRTFSLSTLSVRNHPVGFFLFGRLFKVTQSGRYSPWSCHPSLSPAAVGSCHPSLTPASVA